MSDIENNQDKAELNPEQRENGAVSESGRRKAALPAWSWYKKLAFRIAFIFFVLMSIPLNSGWYQGLFSIDWFRPHYRDIYDIARFSPNISHFFTNNGRPDVDPDGAAQPAERGRSRTGRTTGQSGDRDHTARESDRRAGRSDRNSGSVNVSSQRSEGHRSHLSDSSRARREADSARVAAAGPGPQDRGGNSRQQRSFLADYREWGIILLVAAAGGLIWSLIDRRRREYNMLYYWLRVIVRYRAGIGIIGFGFTKLLPTQMPYPSLGLLNTDLGDLTLQKIYWLSVGIVPWYQVFGGIVEITAGALLLFRRTTTYGAILLVAALGDITFVNYAYDGGVHVYAFYFVLLAAFLLIDDIPKLIRLIVLERPTVIRRYYPDLSAGWLRYTRIGLKSLTFLIFFVILFYVQLTNFLFDPYKQPSTPGVPQLRGNYQVTEFRINNRTIPYSLRDSVRWQQATFEKWTTLTFKVNRPLPLDLSNGGGSPMRDIQRTFEITGVAGGQRAFHYYADTIDQVLYLQDKVVSRSEQGRRNTGRGQLQNDSSERQPDDDWISGTAWKHIGDENTKISKWAASTRRDREFARKPREVRRNRMVLHYQALDGGRKVILSGTDDNRDSIYVVLDRVNKKYNLSESTLQAGKYN